MSNTFNGMDANPDNLGLVAVIGISSRYPGARNVEQFWTNLREARDCITSFSDEELLSAGVNPALVANPAYVKAGGVYENTYLFDAPYFGYTSSETELLDPQHRVFLECCSEALENAGYDPWRYEGRIGLFAGSGQTEYLFELLSTPGIWEKTDAFALPTYNDKDFLSTRVGYDLNLRGPCVTVQTACSTSLVCVTLACQSLLNYQSDIALAGGVTLSIRERRGYLYQEGGIDSRDGRCRTFDADASGIVGASGAGVVVLKRLEDALADRDTIHAVVLGFGLNNDGASRAGFVAPGRDGQVAVIRDAIAMARINPETIGFVECHGTGTPIGDPIEIAALTEAFRSYTNKRGFCAVGSVKTNIGHADTAAGVAGFTKAVLAVKHHVIPASLHFRRPNPEIDFDRSPFFVNTETRNWVSMASPRRAAVTSLGAGGTNAHVILEEPPALQTSASHLPWHLLVWSARTRSALRSMTENLLGHLAEHPGDSLSDIAYTLQLGRRALPYRCFIVCRDHADAGKKLKEVLTNDFASCRENKNRAQVTFLFPGQGCQYVNMGRELYQSEPYFQKHIDVCAGYLRPELGLDIRDLLYPKSNADEAARQLDKTRYTTPVLFAIEYALAQLWMSWGVKPACMIGHSLGEYAAACIAEVLSLPDALHLACVRGRMMQQLPNGSMMAVLQAESELRAEIASFPEISIAVVNGPSACVVSGPTDAVQQLEKRLVENGVACRKLRVSHASHSAMMDPMLEDFRREVQKIQLQAPRLPYISCLSGEWITPAEATSADYWVDHLRRTVRFSNSLEKLLQEPRGLFLEVGPGRMLSSLAAQHPGRSTGHTTLPSLPHPKDDPQTDLEFILNTAGALWLEGAGVDWQAFHAADRCSRIPLPTYPFEGQYYRLMEAQHPGKTAETAVRAQKQKTDFENWFYVPSWKRTGPLIQTRDDQDECWLIFMDDCGLGEEIAATLKAQQKTVLTAEIGDGFEQRSSHHFVVAPHNRECFELLLRELQKSGRKRWRIIHLWSVLKSHDIPDEPSSLEEILERSFYSLLYLGSALGERHPDVLVQIEVISDSLHDVAGEPVFCPARATLLGPCKAIPREYSNVETCHADIVICDDPSRRGLLIQSLLAEFGPQLRDEVIAFRGGHRWVQGLEKFAPPLTEEIPHGSGEACLITGGLGGMGLVFAEYLARREKSRIALLGRSAFPAKTQWREWLKSHEDSDATSKTIQKLLHLEQLGSEVMVCTGDVADPAQMRSVVAGIEGQLGKIRGVIHTAGVAGGGVIGLRTREESARILSPKVQGTMTLSRLFQEHDLRFFVLCSSLTGVLGSAGHADYAAANAFLDAFAHHRNTPAGCKVFSIDWDGWAEVGMRTRLDKISLAPQVRSTWEILPQEGVRILRYVLSQRRLPQVVISTIEMRHQIAESKLELKKAEMQDHRPRVPAHRLRSRPDVPVPYVAPGSELEQAISDVWQGVLGIEKIGVHDSFVQLGGHSLLALQLATRIRKTFEVDFSIHALYEQPTIKGLAEVIISLKKGSICAPESKFADPFSSLEEIKTTGRKRPIFLIHPAGGGVKSYHELAKHLDENQPVYAFQRHIFGSHKAAPYLSIEQMAARYIQVLRAVQPRPPYILGGWSMGGMIAFEMAVQLRECGQEVSLVAIIDSCAQMRSGAQRGPLDQRFAEDLILIGQALTIVEGRNLPLSVDDLRGRSEEEQLTLFLRVAREQHVLSPYIDDNALRAALETLENSDKAIDNHTPRKYSGRVAVFRALEATPAMKEAAADIYDEPAFGWQSFCEQPISVHFVPGDHMHMMAQPCVHELGVQLQKCMDTLEGAS